VKKNTVILTSLALLGLMMVFAAYHVWSRNQTEIQVCDTKRSPDGKWTAIVQMEVDSAVFVTVAVYAVRLKGPAQKDSDGDLVMNVEVNYPDPEPSIDWNNGKLVVTLADHQKYLYFVTPVDGVAIVVQHQ